MKECERMKFVCRQKKNLFNVVNEKSSEKRNKTKAHKGIRGSKQNDARKEQSLVFDAITQNRLSIFNPIQPRH